MGLFVLPDSSWMEGYYLPIAQKIARLRLQYAQDPHALSQLDENQLEVDMYRKYSSWYGYVFYLMQEL